MPKRAKREVDERESRPRGKAHGKSLQSTWPKAATRTSYSTTIVVEVDTAIRRGMNLFVYHLARKKFFFASC